MWAGGGAVVWCRRCSCRLDLGADATGKKVLVDCGPNYGFSGALVQLEMLNDVVTDTWERIMFNAVPDDECAYVGIDGKAKTRAFYIV